MIRKTVYLTMALMTIVSLSCSSDDDATSTTSNLTLNLSGLENLGSDSVYEGWIIVDGSPVSTGTFTVDDTGNLSESTFAISTSMLESATAFVLSIEPTIDPDPSPSAIKILSGDFSGNSANVNTGIIADFSSISGEYVLVTPSTNDTSDDNKGVWFLDPTGGPAPSLNVPDLPVGWRYEGWAIIDGVPISSGRFSSASGADEDGNPFAGTDNTMLPAYPGEDFIMGTVNGVDLSAATHIARVVVSIEPEPDNSPDPFLLKPLIGEALTVDSATAPTLHSLSGTLPSGTVSR